MLKRLGLFALSALFSLLLLELGTRLWIAFIADDEQFSEYASVAQREARAESRGESAFRYSPHHYLGYVPTPNYRRDENYHNALGYRGAPFSLEKPPGEFRIACLGGSTTYTSGVPDSSMAFPPRLEDELRDAGYRDIRVINAGAEGYSTWESLMNLQFRVLDLDPDLVIVYHGINDLFHRMVWPPSAFRGDNSGGLQRPSPAPASPWLFSTLGRVIAIRAGWIPSPSLIHSSFVQLPLTAYAWGLVADLRQGTYPGHVFRRLPPEKLLAANGTVYFERNLQDLAAVARAHGVGVLFATFALTQKTRDVALGHSIFAKGIDEMNRSLEQLGQRIGVPVYDFAAEFPDSPDLYFDAVHVNVPGAKEKARLFARHLIESGTLDAVPRRQR